MKIEWNKLTMRERDAVVAEHVMFTLCLCEKTADGWPKAGYGSARGCCYKCGNPPAQCVSPYSTAIAAAFEVVDELEESKLYLTLYRSELEDGDPCTFCGFTLRGAESEEAPTRSMDTPDAICIAALRAKGHEVTL